VQIADAIHMSWRTVELVIRAPMDRADDFHGSDVNLAGPVVVYTCE
jgi:hypothetical protein